MLKSTVESITAFYLSSVGLLTVFCLDFICLLLYSLSLSSDFLLSVFWLFVISRLTVLNRSTDCLLSVYTISSNSPNFLRVFYQLNFLHLGWVCLSSFTFIPLSLRSFQAFLPFVDWHFFFRIIHSRYLILSLGFFSVYTMISTSHEP